MAKKTKRKNKLSKKIKADERQQPVPEKFSPAEDVEKIARKIIAKYHTYLLNCRIAYLYNDKKMKKSGREVVATAEKVPDKYHALSGYNFVITVSYPAWKDLNKVKKRAVIDHELTHCLVDEDDSGEPVYKIIPHDVEEFASIIIRRGLYTNSLVHIGELVKKAKIPELETEEKVTKLSKYEEDEPEEEEAEDEEENEQTSEYEEDFLELG